MNTKLTFVLLMVGCASATPGYVATSYANSNLYPGHGYGLYGAYGPYYGAGLATSYANLHQVSLAAPAYGYGYGVPAYGAGATSYANLVQGGGYGLYH